MKLKNKLNKEFFFNILALIIITGIVFIANYALITTKAIMKYDAVDGSLPLITYISDSIKNFSLPLWNPMIYYGYPEYSQMGCPNFWYPVMLLLILLTRNGVRIITANYLFHRIFAGFLTYLFVKYIICKIEKINIKESAVFFISLIAGIFYSFSGFFISNAEHDIILISSAWLPFIMLYLMKYLLENKSKFKNFFLVIFGLSMSFIAGYPGVFIITFAVIFLIMMFEFVLKYHNDGLSIIKTFFVALEKDLLNCIVIGIGTLLLSSISIIPYVNSMKIITRGKLDLATIFRNQVTPAALLTMISPSSNTFLHIADISMINFYVGIFIILLIPLIFLQKNVRMKFYFIISIISILLCFGNNTLLYPLLCKVVPIFKYFRFPTLWRIPFSLFIIASVSIALGMFISDFAAYRHVVLKYLKYIGCGLLLCIFSYIFVIKDSSFQQTHLYVVLNEVIVCLLISLLYCIFLDNIDKFGSRLFIICIVVFEVLSFNFVMFESTVGNYESRYILYDNIHRNKKTDYEKNDYLCNYYPTIAPTNGEIINNKIIDEEGYSPYIVRDAFNVDSVYYRYKLLQKPIFFLTNDTVSKKYASDVMKDVDLNNDIMFTDYTTGDNLSNGKESVKKVIQNYDYSSVEKITSSSKDNIDIPIDFKKLNDKKESIYALYIENEPLNKKISFDYVKSDKTLLTNNGVESSIPISGYIDFNSGKHFIILPGNNDISNLRLNLDDGKIKLKKIQLVEINKEDTDKNIKIEQFKNNYIKLTVKSNISQYLVTLQTYHKDWKAYDNGKEINMYETNGNFRSIKIGPGIHNIEFKFKPVDFYIGALITALSYVVAIAIIILCHIRKIKSFTEEKHGK